MDFRQSFQQNNRSDAPAAPATQAAAANDFAAKKATKSARPLGMNILNIIVMVGAALLIGLTAFAFAFNKPADEQKYVDTSLYQAVFLNNGQVYFGKVDALNSRYIDLSDVYYLTQAQATAANAQASSDYTLVKLGCQQIHYPEDQMLISRDQVTFWENLSKDGKVAKSIADFKKQNANGENCKEVSNTTQSTTAPTQSTGGATQSTTPTTNSTTNTNTTNTTNPATNR